jgi:uncharacterized LabA/DUF88 family protein
MIKVLSFIDFSNLSCQLRSVGRKPNMPELIKEFGGNGRFVVDSWCYCALPPENGAAVSRFHDAMRHMGINVVARRAKRLPNGEIKGNLDLELALDAIEICSDVRPDVAILVTGDGDFSILAQRLRRKGIRVEIASLQESLGSDLKAAGSGWIDLTSYAQRCDPLHANGNAPALGGDAILEDF